MSSLHNPENRNNSHAALPSLGKRTEEQTPYSEREKTMTNTAAPYTTREGVTLHFANCTTKAEHINCIREWIKDSKTDLAVSGDPLTSTDYAYFQGQIAAWELTLELIAGTILEEQTTVWVLDK